MILRRKATLFLSSVGAGLFACWGGASADELPAGRAERAQAQCNAAYGPGFSAVEGSDTCVWVGGHVRVEFGSRGTGSPDNGWANGGAVRVNSGDYSGDGAKATPGHLRLRDGEAAGSIAR